MQLGAGLDERSGSLQGCLRPRSRPVASIPRPRIPSWSVHRNPARIDRIGAYIAKYPNQDFRQNFRYLIAVLTHRTFKFKGHLTAAGHERFDKTLGLLTDLYNAGLEERIGAYRWQRKSIRYFDQCKQITDLRREFPDLAAVDVRILPSPLNRLNKAFGGFFSRIKNGQAPGFPGSGHVGGTAASRSSTPPVRC